MPEDSRAKSIEEFEAKKKSSFNHSFTPTILEITKSISLTIQNIFEPLKRIVGWLETYNMHLSKMFEDAITITCDEKIYDRIEERYQTFLLEAKWFPNIVCVGSMYFMFALIDAIESTRAQKSRSKKIDKVVFDCFDKDTLDAMKREWKKNPDISSHTKRILAQAVNAYYRREYALTTSALIILWEGLIATKLGKENEYRAKPQKRLSELNEENDIGKVVTKFCEDYIFYDCRKTSDFIEDVPGRNSYVHSWNVGYPTRKAALNAILFTDFLLSLKAKEQPLEEKQNG